MTLYATVFDTYHLSVCTSKIFTRIISEVGRSFSHTSSTLFHFSPGTSHYARGNEWISLRLWGVDRPRRHGGCTTSNVTDVIFFLPVLESRPTGSRRDGGEGEAGENNLKAELNFSSSESFVRALGGGQWLNGDVSRKVDSRERPALYRPSIHPLLLILHPHESAEARAHSPISSRKNIYSRKRKREKRRKGRKSCGFRRSCTAIQRLRAATTADFGNSYFVSTDYM